MEILLSEVSVIYIKRPRMGAACSCFESLDYTGCRKFRY
jgi:hypothetical protein